MEIKSDLPDNEDILVICENDIIRLSQTWDEGFPHIIFMSKNDFNKIKELI